MLRSHCLWCASLVITSMAVAAQVPDTGRADAPDPYRAWPWPCQVIVAPELQALAERAWDGSSTFREQCRKLAAARAVVIVSPDSSRGSRRAQATIGVTADGARFARVRLRRAGAAVEYLAHELEHVLEHVEGVKFLMESTRGNSRVSLTAGAYETQRAIDTGRRVAAEVREAQRTVAAIR